MKPKPYLKRLTKSKQSLNSTLNVPIIALKLRKEKLNLDKTLIAETLTELGFIELLMNDNRKEAKRFWNKAIHEYSGYSMDMALHTRIYTALREFDITPDDDEDSYSCEPLPNVMTDILSLHLFFLLGTEDSVSVASDNEDFGDQFVESRLELMQL